MIELFKESRWLKELSLLEKSQKCVILAPNFANKILQSTNTKQQIVYYENKNLKVKISALDVEPNSFDKSEIIVVYTDRNLKPLKGKSEVLIEKSGQNIQDELETILVENEGSFPIGQVYFTTSGRLKNYCGILHCSINEAKNISIGISECLQECDFREFTSLAFTILDQNQIPFKTLINFYINSIQKYFNLNPFSSIKEIYLIDSKSDQIFEILTEKFNNSNVEEIAPKKVAIKVIYGSIVDPTLKVDAIVNSTDRKLLLNSGAISTSILQAAGDEILNEIKYNYPNGIEKNHAAFTKAGKMQNVDWIFHICLSNWDQAKTDKIEKDLIENIIYCLKLADTLDLTSIAFPSLGTGNLNYPKDLVPKVMFKAVNDYFAQNESQINQVYFVIYKNDQSTVDAFRKFENIQPKEVDDEFSIKINGINIRVYLGDITQAKTDFIFNPTNKNLDLNGNVSQALLKADPSLKTKIDSLNSKDFCITDASGSLNCSYIVHINVEDNKIENSVSTALNELCHQGFETITFPVIGTGKQASHLDSSKCCLNLFESILSFLNDQTVPKKSLKKVEICILPKQKAFLKYFSANFKNEEPKISFKLISNNLNNLNLVKQYLDEIAEQEKDVKDFRNEYLTELDSNTRNEIENICCENRTSFKWDLKSVRPKLTLSGLHKNISNTILRILNLITEHFKFKESKISAQITSEKVQWEFKLDDEWVKFDLILNNELEKKYQSGSNLADIKDKENKRFYAIDFKNYSLQIKEGNLLKKGDLRRLDMNNLRINIECPLNWEPSKQMDLIDLAISSQEYKTVLQLLTNKGLGANLLKKVISIHRIQNRHLYVQYKSFKLELEKLYQNAQIEHTLFHGTSEDSVESIWKTGFNRSYAGKNATAFGKGVYFARDSSYSHGYTDKRHGLQKGHMFIAKVLVGKTCVGHGSLKVPQANADTTVDNVQNPSVFVVFKDAQAYPEYLLTYE